MGLGALGDIMGGGGPAGGAAPGGGGGQPGQADTPEFQAKIDQAVAALHEALGMDEDDTDKQVVADCLQKLQAFKATQQKQQDAALGVTDVHRGVRRAVRSAGGGGGSSY